MSCQATDDAPEMIVNGAKSVRRRPTATCTALSTIVRTPLRTAFGRETIVSNAAATRSILDATVSTAESIALTAESIASTPKSIAVETG